MSTSSVYITVYTVLILILKVLLKQMVSYGLD